MRVLVGLLLAVSVLGLAFWAYQENYRTRQALADARALTSEIGALREQRTVLKAEWAYLNRPDRLRELAALNFGRLGLLPMTPEHFGRLDQVAYPAAETPAAAPDALPQTTAAEAQP